MQASSTKTLCDAPQFTLNVATGDSLIHGRGAPQVDQGQFNISASGELLDAELVFTYSTETVSDYVKTVDLLGLGSYHVVVGNPPYIVVQDSSEDRSYRHYQSCSGTYPLSVPFVERFFKLAISAREDHKGSGFTGQITANSFMKREFGKKLVTEFFRTITLTHAIDTSGAYIPGHGTPTVILIGRPVYPREQPVRTILGIRGEPSQPANPALGQVWQAIVDALKSEESDDLWVDYTTRDAKSFTRHPWNLSGGGAARLHIYLEAHSKMPLCEIADVGTGAVTRENDVFIVGAGTLRRNRIDSQHQKPLLDGKHIRDWRFSGYEPSLWPYSKTTLKPDDSPAIIRFLWPWRTQLRRRIAFGQSQIERGLPWTAYSMFFGKRFKGPTISFAFVQTHNQFALDEHGRAFNRTAPIIKLNQNILKELHFPVLGCLNSSTACFWLKQVSHNKGEGGGARVQAGYSAMGTEEWKNTFEFTSTKLEQFPLPTSWPKQASADLYNLSGKLDSVDLPTANTLDASQLKKWLSLGTERIEIRKRMIALQEELDWEVYRLYGLLSEEEAAGLVADPGVVPGVALGERAFEIVLARRVAAGEVETQWFARHGSTPITEVPAHWPEAYRRVVEKRIETIEKRPQTIGLIERPEYKRRWATEPWEKKEKAALRGWLLDRCEARELWFAADDDGGEWPRPMTVGRLADRLRNDADFVSVARLYAGEDADVLDVLVEIVGTEHVPFLAAWRYKESGLQKRAKWERTWDLQRREDETGERLDIPVPPKYASTDFTKVSYWRNRGKLDVPKERLISYPQGGPDGDGTLLVGWAGWDHREQAHALMTLIEERTTQDGWELERLLPLLAGLDEVLPWVKQWHGEIDPMFGMSPADAYDGYLQQQLERHGLPREELTRWRPPKGRRAAAGTIRRRSPGGAGGG